MTTPNPRRITLALDARGLYGPDVDTACGAREPDVDRWEDPNDPLLPTAEQLVKLAALTGMTVEWFNGDEPPLGRLFICDLSRRKHGLTIVEPDGTVSVDPPPLRRRTTPEDAMADRRPAHPRTPRRGPRPTRVRQHQFVPDPDVPADADGGRYCARCGCRGEPGDTHHLAAWDELPPTDPDVTAAERRRTGDKE
jgi:hypothetical protein